MRAPNYQPGELSLITGNSFAGLVLIMLPLSQGVIEVFNSIIQPLIPRVIVV